MQAAIHHGLLDLGEPGNLNGLAFPVMRLETRILYSFQEPHNGPGAPERSGGNGAPPLDRLGAP
jgi:hypothetical protein